MKANGEPAPTTADCVVENVARVLAEEPRLEAVAFESKSRKLAMATLGHDAGDRLARRVTEAVHHQTRNSRCAVPDGNGKCSECGTPMEGRAGGGRVVVKQVLGNTLIEKNTCTTAVSLWRWRDLRWPKFVPRELELLPSAHPDEHGHEHGHAHGEGEWKTIALQAAGCALAALAGLVAERLGAPSWLILICWLSAYVLGAWEAAEESWERLRAGALDVHFLMLSVALGATAVGAWHEGALLLFLFSASGAMEHFAQDRTRREIGTLLHGAPKLATVLDDDGTERAVLVGSLEPGLRVRVTAGQQVPVDLRVTKGDSACDESNLTGESRPVPKTPGDDLLAGTLNLQGLLEGRVLRRADESALQKVIRLIEKAQTLRAPSQRFTDKFGTGYTYGILGLCGAMFLVWWLGAGLPAFVAPAGGRSAFYRAMTLLVVASPCALVLSIPSAILSAIAFGARRGVLFRGGAAVENLARIDAVALDKTGTLTAGELTLVRVETFAGSEEDVCRTAYNLARFSDHPLSRAIKRFGAEAKLPLVEPEEFESVPGQGLRANYGGRDASLGRREWVGPLLPAGTAAGAAPVDESAEVWVAGAGVAGRMIFQDAPRPEAAATLRRLQDAGLQIVMLTGDRMGTAQRVAGDVGITDVRAGLLPADKLAAIQELKSGGTRRVAMVGDGVNDAPSLAAADVSVAMGARGSDAALEQAAVVLMNDRLENFFVAYDLSRRAQSIIRQNLALSLGTVALMVAASLCGIVPLALGVAAHEGSTVLVVLNSLRLLLAKPSAPTAAS